MRIKYYYVLLFFSLLLGSCATKKQLPSQAVPIATETKEYDNDVLTAYCNDWLGSPYKLGGVTKKGVDCSGFVYSTYKDLYDVTLPRRSAEMISAVEAINTKDSLQKGDILFFNNKAGKINHVGIYLENNRFIHSSSSRGIIISTLEETYWKQHYRCGGRLPQEHKIK